MMTMDVLTWTFRAAYAIGMIVAFSAAMIYHRRTQGAWHLRPAGVMIMTLVLALGTAFATVTLRVMAMALKKDAPWLEGVSLAVSLIAVWTVVGALCWFLWLVHREQPDFSERKNMATSAAPRWRQPRFWADLAERAGWTAAEVIVSYVSVDTLQLPPWAVMPVTVGLMLLKGLVAKHFGTKDTAALAPGL